MQTLIVLMTVAAATCLPFGVYDDSHEQYVILPNQGQVDTAADPAAQTYSAASPQAPQTYSGTAGGANYVAVLDLSLERLDADDVVYTNPQHTAGASAPIAQTYSASGLDASGHGSGRFVIDRSLETIDADDIVFTGQLSSNTNPGTPGQGLPVAKTYSGSLKNLDGQYRVVDRSLESFDSAEIVFAAPQNPSNAGQSVPVAQTYSGSVKNSGTQYRVVDRSLESFDSAEFVYAAPQNPPNVAQSAPAVQTYSAPLGGPSKPGQYRVVVDRSLEDDDFVYRVPTKGLSGIQTYSANTDNSGLGLQTKSAPLEGPTANNAVTQFQPAFQYKLVPDVSLEAFDDDLLYYVPQPQHNNNVRTVQKTDPVQIHAV